MKICKDGRIWGQNNKEASGHLGTLYHIPNKGTASESKKSNKNPMYGKRHSQKTKKKMSQNCVGRDNPFYGKSHSEKTKEEWSKKRTGKNNPNWCGGISKEPYSFDFNKEFKELIRKRDNFTCQICDKTEKELRYKLHCHHIDYNKKNDEPNNLVSLCRSCHIKTNYNRYGWIIYFRNHKKERELQWIG